MKKFYYLLIFFFLTAFVWHKYYVSVTEVYVKNDKLEIIIRAFPDDMENILRDDYHISPDFSTKETGDYLKMYLQRKFKVSIDSIEMPIHFLGSTLQDGFLVLLLEVPVNKSFKSVQIKNTLLMDLFDEQKNIIHFLYENKKESFILTKRDFIAKFIK